MFKKIRLFLLACFLLVASISFADYVPGQLVVRFKPGVIRIPKGLSVASVKEASISVASVRALSEKYGVTRFEQIYRSALEIMPSWKHLENDYLITFTKGEVSEAVEEYKKDPNVIDAYPNTIVRAFATIPNDPYFSRQWGLISIEAHKGWSCTQGSSDITIAVFDTGVNYNHEDLLGKVDTENDRDFVNRDFDAMDDNGHGTSVAGVIAAVTNNNKGIAGVDWRAKILPIKVLDHAGNGSITFINQGLAHVTALRASYEASGGKTGANVVAVNMSLGDYQDPGSELADRCQDAYNYGLVLVAAAGNGDVDWPSYPACYPTVLAVAAVNASGKRSEWTGIDLQTHRVQKSNYGTWIDVSAPGSDIYSTDSSGSYDWKNGTSFAAPFVTGLASLLKASNSSLTSEMIMKRIKDTADNIDALNPGFEGLLGTGRINVFRALGGLSAQITSPANGDYLKGKVEIRGTASGWSFSCYSLEAISGSTMEVIATGVVSVESGLLGVWDTTNYPDDNYTIRLKTYSADGTSAESSVRVIVDNTSPEVNINFPSTGTMVAGKVNILGKAKDKNFDRYLLEYGKGDSPVTFQNISTKYVSVEGPLGTWETSGLKGEYTLRLIAYDRAGNVSQTSALIDIYEIPPIKELKIQPNLPLTFALPNPFNRSVTSEVSLVYELMGNFDTSIYLFDLGGNLIWRKRYTAGENGGKAGVNNPSWNGQNLFGEEVPNGVYIYQITTDQKVIGRGKIIVLN